MNRKCTFLKIKFARKFSQGIWLRLEVCIGTEIRWDVRKSHASGGFVLSCGRERAVKYIQMLRGQRKTRFTEINMQQYMMHLQHL